MIQLIRINYKINCSTYVLTSITSSTPSVPQEVYQQYHYHDECYCPNDDPGNKTCICTWNRRIQNIERTYKFMSHLQTKMWKKRNRKLRVVILDCDQWSEINSLHGFSNEILSGIPSECQTFWIKIRPDVLLGLIWVQTVCKCYQHSTKVALVGKRADCKVLQFLDFT